MQNFNKQVWKEIKDLSSAEIEIIKKYEKEPYTMIFIQMADILRKRGFIDEAIVIMEDGIKHYPKYYTARSYLAKDYYVKGMLKEANYNIEQVLEKNIDNMVAQRLKLKLEILFGDKKATEQRIQILYKLYPDDDFTKAVRNFLSLDDFLSVQNMVISELESLGVRYTPNNDNDKILENIINKSTSNDTDEWILPTQSHEKANTTINIEENIKNYDHICLAKLFKSSDSLETILGNSDKYLLLNGFRRINCTGFFNKNYLGSDINIGLEGTTLAEIYITQGLYTKALTIYERLIRDNPKSKAYQSRLEYLKTVCNEQNIKKNNLLKNNSFHKITYEKEKKMIILQKLLTKIDALKKGVYILTNKK